MSQVLKIVQIKKDSRGYQAIIENMEKTGLYPDGKGGQIGDRGRIGNIEILEVGENYVYLKDSLEPGKYQFTINESRREDIKVQHTSQHIFSAIAFRDYSLNTVGFRMSEDYTTVDLDSNNISEKVIENLEKKVNMIAKQGIDIIEHFYSLEDAYKIEGLRKGISEKVTGDVRVIEIPELDLNACGGFHVSNTKEIQVFKILRWEKVKGNFTRFYLVAGERAFKDYTYKNNTIKELNRIFSCQDHEIIEMVNKFTAEKKAVESSVKYFIGEYSALLAESLKNDAITICGGKAVIYEGDESIANSLSRFIDNKEYLYIGIGKNSMSISSEIMDCKELVAFLLERNPEIKGGGSPVKANIKGTIPKTKIVELLREFCGKL